jgi:hypothetical protein
MKFNKKAEKNRLKQFFSLFALGKKGLMVKFLTSLLLAIIIFAPACMIGSKVFRTSEQAKENYADLVSELIDFAANSFVGEQSSEILIMDSETAIVYFEGKEDLVKVEVDDAIYKADYTLNFAKPSACSESSGTDIVGCLCLFRDTEYEKEELNLDIGEDFVTVDIKSDRVLCQDLNFPLELESCAVGNPETVQKVSCSGGFVIERNLAEVSKLALAYAEDNRKRTIYLTRTDTEVVLTDSKAASIVE